MPSTAFCIGQAIEGNRPYRPSRSNSPKAKGHWYSCPSRPAGTSLRQAPARQAPAATNPGVFTTDQPSPSLWPDKCHGFDRDKTKAEEQRNRSEKGGGDCPRKMRRDAKGDRCSRPALVWVPVFSFCAFCVFCGQWICGIIPTSL